MNVPLNKPRSKANSNLTQFTGSHYSGLPIQVDKGPFFEQYLQQTLATIYRALSDYPRLLAIRFDLHYPQHQVLSEDARSSTVITRFVESLKAKVRHNRLMALENNKRVHDTVVRYVWVKEYGGEGRPHYHFLLLLNKDAFHTLGSFNSNNENLYLRILSAWASALNLSGDEVVGLVHVPESPIYYLNHCESSNDLAALFYRASYLCKVDTKRYGGWEHAFGCSRI